MTAGFDLQQGDRAPGWTPKWTAPEQVTGQPVSFAADLYPLGVMLSRLLADEPIEPPADIWADAPDPLFPILRA